MPGKDIVNSDAARRLGEAISDEYRALERLLRGAGRVSAQTVHKLRLRCKRLRALLRLLPPCAEVEHADRLLADLAGQFSATRDARVLCDLATRLGPRCDPPVKHGSRVMRWLRRNARRAEAAIPATLTAAREGFPVRSGLRQPVQHAEEPALNALLRDGRESIARAAAEARRKPTRRHFHHWRTVTKCYVLQRRLLGLDDVGAEPGWRKWRRLGEALGDLHDLDVLIHVLRHAPRKVRDARSARRLLAAARAERGRQREDVLRLYSSAGS